VRRGRRLGRLPARLLRACGLRGRLTERRPAPETLPCPQRTGHPASPPLIGGRGSRYERPRRAGFIIPGEPPRDAVSTPAPSRDSREFPAHQRWRRNGGQTGSAHDFPRWPSPPCRSRLGRILSLLTRAWSLDWLLHRAVVEAPAFERMPGGSRTRDPATFRWTNGRAADAASAFTSCRHVVVYARAEMGPACVKTKSDLVVMPSGGRIFASGPGAAYRAATSVGRSIALCNMHTSSSVPVSGAPSSYSGNPARRRPSE
jgi:hypothetical protein